MGIIWQNVKLGDLKGNSNISLTYTVILSEVGCEEWRLREMPVDNVCEDLAFIDAQLLEPAK
jgi:hypothetical protein